VNVGIGALAGAGTQTLGVKGPIVPLPVFDPHATALPVIVPESLML
jgi:hypothetical protein